MRLIKYLGVNPEKKNQIYRKVVMNEKINLHIREIRVKFSIPDGDNLTSEEFIKLLENDQLQKESTEIVKKFDLPKTWVDIIHQYIIDGKFIPDNDPDGLKIIFDDSNGKFFLEIFPYTSIEDIKNVWFLVLKEFKSHGFKKTKKKKSKKFNRNLYIDTLKRSGKTISEIDSEVNKKHKEDLDHGLIKTVASTVKKMRKG